MITWSIALFELRQRFARISTYVYFVLFFAIAHLVTIAAGGAFPSANVVVGGSGGRTLVNSPFVLAALISVVSYLGVTVMAAVMGQAVYQDFHYRTHTLFFTSPISKHSYLGGRFIGAFVLLVVVFSSVALGCWTGSLNPKVDPSLFGPNQLASYLRPYLVIVLPNMLFIGAAFFALAAISRRILPVYAASVVLLIGYLIASTMSRDVESKWAAALLDPFGFAAVGHVTEYWTVAERNTRQLPLTGALLWNRLLWLGISAVISGATLYKFRFQYGGEGARRRVVEREPAALPPQVRLPSSPPRDFRALRLLPNGVWLNFAETVRNVYFAVIVLAGIMFIVLASRSVGAIFGTETHPVTASMVGLAGDSFALFMLIIITFYSGELVWRERDANVDQLCDVLPTPTWLPLASKMIALALVQALLLLVVMLCGAAIQAAQGYFRFEWGVYLRELFGVSLIDYVLISVLAITVQVLVNHKYLGHFVMVLYYVATTFMGSFGFEHHLYDYAGHPGHTYSDINGFGHFVQGIAWFQMYWALCAVLLAILSNLFWVRGVESNWTHRLRTARRRCTAPVLATLAGAAVAFVGVGIWIFYNTNVLNTFKTRYQQQRESAEYEQKYKQFADAPQPRVVAVQARFELFPQERDLWIEGVLSLRNKTDEPVSTVYVNTPSTAEVTRLSLGAATAPTESDTVQGFHTFALSEPLEPGQEIALSFKLTYDSRGFRNDSSDQDVVYNGTFINSGLLPHLGYEASRELSEDATRRKFDLPPKERMANVDDLRARRNNYISSDADWVSLDAIVGTAADQIAIVPGYLQKEWTENGRRYFHYRTEGEILNFFSMLSARYAVKRDTWTGPVAFGKSTSPPTSADSSDSSADPLLGSQQEVALEIYYQPGHEFNLDGMVEAMKSSLDYYTANFSPYQHRQLRIIEFPRYAMFAQSFPNTIPYSEAIGFVAKVDPQDPDDIDYPYYVTAHEVAHQWWAHQVIGGKVQGATVMSETLAQYSALMVMKKKFGAEQMRRFLRYELSQYLMGRGTERKKELPLAFNENQPYIHYNKGSLVMYALQDSVGEDVVNRALASYIRDVAYQEPPYTNSRELLDHLRLVTPSELQYFIEDAFETITLFDNRAVSAVSIRQPSGAYQVTVKIAAAKLRSDDQGRETPVPLNDLIDIGVLDEAGKPLVMEKRHLNEATASFTFTVNQKPAKAGIDPLNKLIDRKPGDNVTRVQEQSAATE